MALQQICGRACHGYVSSRNPSANPGQSILCRFDHRNMGKNGASDASGSLPTISQYSIVSQGAKYPLMKESPKINHIREPDIIILKGVYICIYSVIMTLWALNPEP